MISFIICANSKWIDYATPMIDSLLWYGPGTEVVLVDNGSPKPYPESWKYKLVRLDPGEQYNYMEALNAGGRVASGDWLVFCNDDILCYGKFVECISELETNFLCGMEIRQKDTSWGVELQYIYGWMLIMNRKIWERVGEFDPYYFHAGLDDIDFSWRAQQAGFAVRKVDLPFIHLADQPGGRHRRKEVPHYRENMVRSKEHFLEKVHAAENILSH